MNTRPKSVRTTRHNRASRGVQKPQSNLSVMPVATQTSATGSDAVIPVSVTGEGSSAAAVIPVEVQTRGKQRRRRAAVLPITVQKRSADTRRRRVRNHRQTAKERQHSQPAYAKPWGSFIDESITGVLDIERAVLEIGVEYGRTALTAVQSMLWPLLGRPADVQPVGRAEVLVQRSPQHVASAAMARAA